MGVLVIIGTIVWLKPVPVSASVSATHSIAATSIATGVTGQNDYQKVQAVLEQRCYQCPGAQLQMKNIRLDNPQLVSTHAQTIYQQVVVTRQMPMNNATGVTDDERQLIKQWFEAGAKVA